MFWVLAIDTLIVKLLTLDGSRWLRHFVTDFKSMREHQIFGRFCNTMVLI